MSERRVIGFDRELRLEWLDAIASRAAAGESPDAARRWMDAYLTDVLGGKGHSGHRGKTVTVLTRIWINVPSACAPIQSRAAGLLERSGADERLALHWAMASAVYPFFLEVVAVVGRLLALQEEVERQAVIRRVVEAWGDRPAVSRGCRAIWSSIVAWGVLAETSRRGRYAPLSQKLCISPTVMDVLSDAVAGSRPHLTRATLPDAALATFPFIAGKGHAMYRPPYGAAVAGSASTTS